jgi:hypothetical protein
MNEEERFDFEQKHEEDLQRLRGFRLLDDDFMSKVFEDKNCVEFLLQIILKRDDLKVTSVSSQYVIKTYKGVLFVWIFSQWIDKIRCIILKFKEMIKVQV